MKYYFTLIFPFVIGLLFFPAGLQAQLSGIGIGGGGSFSTFDYGGQVNSINEFDSKNKGGGTGGIRLDFDLGSDLLKLSPEFFIVQNGAKEYYTDFKMLQNELINREVALDYVGIYLPLTFYIPIDDGFDITEGRYNGMLIQARLFGDYAIHTQINNELLGVSNVEFRSNEDKIDFGYAFEAGFVAQGMKFSFGYNWGIKNIEFYNALGDVDSGKYLINNKGFTIQIGYLHKIE